MSHHKFSYVRMSVEEYEANQVAWGFKGRGSRSKDGKWVLASNGSKDPFTLCDQSPEIPAWIPDTYPVRIQIDGNWTTEQQPLKASDPHYNHEQTSFINSLVEWLIPNVGGI